MEIALVLAPHAIIGGALFGLFIYLPYRCLRYGWRITLYGFLNSF